MLNPSTTLLFAVDLYVVVLLKNHAPIKPNICDESATHVCSVKCNSNFWLPVCATDRYKLRNSRELKHSVQQFL